MNDIFALFELTEVDFINLQCDFTEEIEAIEHQYNNFHTIENLDLKNDFDGLAALISNLDLVITPTNSVIAFAAATGIETWMLYQYHFPMQLGTNYFPWFPTVKTFCCKDLIFADQRKAIISYIIDDKTSRQTIVLLVSLDVLRYKIDNLGRRVEWLLELESKEYEFQLCRAAHPSFH